MFGRAHSCLFSRALIACFVFVYMFVCLIFLVFQSLIGSILGLPSTDDKKQADLYQQCDEFVFKWTMANKQQYITTRKVRFAIKKPYLTAAKF